MVGPKGFKVIASKMDLRVGGTYHYGMQTPNGGAMWGKFTYREIVPQEKLVFINSFSDEKGGITRHPSSATWPLEMLSTFTFEDLPGGKTKFTVRWSTLNATAEEQKTFDTMHDSMTQGWSGTMEQLAAYLASGEIDGGNTMQIAAKTITPCLWFDTQAEEAAKFYCSVFKNSKITSISRYPDAGQDVHHKPAGSVMVVAFELDGQPFTALNGGPQFKFDEAVSFQVYCDTQAEIDYYWNALTKGGQEGPCGWLKDKFGLSWQVVPSAIPKMMTDPDAKKSARVMNAFMKMKKLDLATLERAYEGQSA